VRSRVSWGAILAGAVIALAVYFLLSALGVALGLSLSDRVDPNNLGTGAGIYALVSYLVALFLGGFLVVTLVTNNRLPLMAIAAGAALAVVPLWYVRRKSRHRVRGFEDDVPAAVPVEDRSGRKETQLANGDPQSPADEGELSRDSHQLDRAGRLDIRRQQ